MPEEWVDLRDLGGPYAGRVRPYLKHAAENAVASGFAEYVAPREAVGEAPPVVPGAEVEPAIDATDAAIDLAAEEGVDLASLVGSGKDGRILQADVEEALAEREEAEE